MITETKSDIQMKQAVQYCFEHPNISIYAIKGDTMIDELSKTMTTAQVVRHYTKRGFAGHLALQSDLLKCSEGNRRAIQAVLGLEVKQYDQGEFLDITPDEEALKIKKEM